MPDLILTTPSGFDVGYPAFYEYDRRDTAMSRVVKKAFGETARYFEQSQALFGAKAAAISSIQEILAECSEENWDGFEAESVSPLTAQNAEDFIRSLPDGFPVPELAPEPDGSISLDWTISNDRRVVLSVGESNRLAFAWMNRSDAGQATVTFDSIDLPDWFLLVIGSIVNYAKPSFRIA